MNKGPGIISGNLSFIGAFIHKEDADEYFAKCMDEIPEGWTGTGELGIFEINGKYVVRILATKDQSEFDFDEPKGDLFEQA